VKLGDEEGNKGSREKKDSGRRGSISKLGHCKTAKEKDSERSGTEEGGKKEKAEEGKVHLRRGNIIYSQGLRYETFSGGESREKPAKPEKARIILKIASF